MLFSRQNDWKPNIVGLVIIGLATLIFTAGCGTPGKNLPVTTAAATVGTDNVQVVNVQVKSFYFKPSRIEVVANKPVRLVLTKSSLIVPHNFSLHAPDAGIDIDKNVGHGNKVIVEFTPTKPGEYQFFCDKDGHAKKGMVGTLVVK